MYLPGQMGILWLSAQGAIYHLENKSKTPPRRAVIMNKSIGEQRVRTEFNPSKEDVIDQIKQKSAELINLVESVRDKDPRLASLAQTGYEEAAMWAVKCATA